MKKLSLAIAAILVAATPAPDHGGKIKWTVPKNAKEYDALIEACNAAGKPAFLYFTMDGWHYCDELDAGAFSDDEVVKTSEKISRFMLLAGKSDAVWKKFGVTGAPTLIFVDPTGKKVGTGDRGSATLIKQIGETLEKFTRAPKWSDSVEAATDEAKKDQKPLVVVYRDAKPASETALEAFGAQALAEQYGKAVWVQKTLDIKSDEAKSLGISAVPALWIIDPRVDDAKTRVLKKIGLPKPGAAISKELASVLKSWKKSSTEAPAEEPKKE